MVHYLEKILTGIQHPGFFKAVLGWRKFSLASFLIVSRLARSGVRPGTVLDLGANVGQFAIASANLFGSGASIISFEPDPQTVEALRKNVNGFSVEVMNIAIGKTPGASTFFVNADSQVSSLLPLGATRLSDFPESIIRKEIKVPVESLDHLFMFRKLTLPILLKIDVQGFEYEVIAGATNFLKKVKWVVMEVSFTDLYKGEADFSSIFNLLESKGFRFLRPLNMHFSPKTGEVIEMDALFVNSNENTDI
jgi:FkbM family methyltransferase